MRLLLISRWNRVIQQHLLSKDAKFNPWEDQYKHSPQQSYEKFKSIINSNNSNKTSQKNIFMMLLHCPWWNTIIEGIVLWQEETWTQKSSKQLPKQILLFAEACWEYVSFQFFNGISPFVGYLHLVSFPKGISL